MSINNARQVAEAAARAAEDKKAENVEILKMPQVMVDAEYFVICSAPTHIQIRAIVHAVTTALKEAGAEMLRVEGRSNNNWVLLDYGHVVVHIFQAEAYLYYSLDKLWADAERIAWA